MSTTPTPASSKISDTDNSKDIDGKSIAKSIRSEITTEIQEIQKSHPHAGIPGLAVILVGSRLDSATYVKMKKKACAECGIASFGYDYPESVTESELLIKVQELNADTAIHGILIQLPLPLHINENTVLNAVDPKKDVDGLHPVNAACLYNTSTHHSGSQQQQQQNQNPRLDWSDLRSIPFHIACTPQGCIELLDRSSVPLRGCHVVVMGRSNLVGLPISMLLLHRDATVTIVHSKTENAPSIVSKADVIIAAVGKPHLLQRHWIKDGAVVIDVGINSIDDPKSKKGYRLVGDVDYDDVYDKVGKITPVPGGVGPMTIAMLLRNTLNAFKRSISAVTTPPSSSTSTSS